MTMTSCDDDEDEGGGGDERSYTRKGEREGDTRDDDILTVKEGQLRIAEHTDVSVFTILNIPAPVGHRGEAVDGGSDSPPNGGLELLNKSKGEWCPVNPRNDAFVVNIGT